MPNLDGLHLPGIRRRPSVSWQHATERPQVVAHRGASSTAAEHTLDAYIRALEDGAEGLECDVRLTADSHLVCVHDRRIDRTSNGRGVVSSLELGQLEELDWASWKRPWQELDDEAADLSGPAGSILTLERLLDTVHDWGKPVDLTIETKHPTRYAGLVEQRLIELLDRYGWARPRRGQTSPAHVMSFSWMSLRRCLEMAPALEMVYLMDRVPLRFRDGTLPLGSRVAGPSINIVRAHPEYVAKAHSVGNAVYVWTVNNPADIDMCASLGVDAIITDVPGRALLQLTDHAR
ncbi:MAG: glycerophosphodiester phosphodiesterase [Propionibacteriales bacterium]|nr:glycerophosphodiester phosphodiesterase [Propionibacteriales bacterium]